MRRSVWTAALLAALVLAVGGLSGCQRTVEVQTGVRVECPYGHVDNSEVTSVEVPAKTAAAYRVRTEKRVCDRHVALEELYAEAQTALAAGDVKTAQAKLEAVSAEDAGFRQTATQLQAIAKGEKPKPDTGEGSPEPSVPATVTPKPGEGDTSGPVGSLKKYTPDELDGFTARSPSIDGFSIARQYAPSGSSDAASLVIVAEQFRTPAEAKRALDAQMTGYSQDAATQKLNGHDVVSGNDGRTFLSAGFTEGSVFVVLEMAAKAGTDPQDLKSSILDAIKQLP
ncbi:MAG: hypothetical protein U1E26_09975 [Coriobacteriia bacterium]|nr:hypothetical protein [Coriobacteriia bacterium]